MPASEFEETVKREVQFNTSPVFWADMLDKGATYIRWDDMETISQTKTAREIVLACENTRCTVKPTILMEIEQNKRLEETTAYKILTEERQKKLDRERRDMLEEAEEERRRLQREKAELQAVLAREQEDVRRGIETLERIERPSLMSSLGSRITHPLQRRFSDFDANGHNRSIRPSREPGPSRGQTYRGISPEYGDNRIERGERVADIEARVYESEQERPRERRGRRRLSKRYDLIRIPRR